MRKGVQLVTSDLARMSTHDIQNHGYCSQRNALHGSWGDMTIDLGAPTPVSSYRYRTAGPDRTPRGWLFQGSNDGSSWCTLDTFGPQDRAHSSVGTWATDYNTSEWGSL